MFKGGDSFKHIKDLPPAFNRQHADHSVVLPDFTLNLYSHTHTHTNITHTRKYHLSWIFERHCRIVHVQTRDGKNISYILNSNDLRNYF